ncbi:autotransporter domain-containing protein [Sebaldella sp. S0638]|uniref:autotransporter domain-containing protein n=1 Tax=Sebaldella sp. S0638 TaxID=2957809 RepID=UPI0020A16F11|nr:autotransporter domain-containing protein [Sebaldella sp. S0638]MCP1223577.1 autotransporter domain-containing protein [Sebaldella sp. S0638]
MKKNKKMLVLFLSLNSMLTSYADTIDEIGTVSSRYDRMYNSIIKNIRNEKPTQKNYQSIENILKKKNKELKDLYLQGDYIIKPEYLEWQVFFSGFYTEKEKGDNTMENAEYYTSARTQSGKLTVDSKIYNELLATGMTAGQVEALFNGDRNVMNSLTNEQRNIFYDQNTSSGTFKSFNQKEDPKNIKLGASIPIKEVLDFSLDPQMKIVEKTINPITVTLPNTKVEKIMITDFRGITAPTPQAPVINITVNPTVSINSPDIDFNFSAGHNAGAPMKLNGSAVNYDTNNNQTISMNYTRTFNVSDTFHIVNSPGGKMFFAQGTNVEFTNSNPRPADSYGRFFAENRNNASVLANYGSIKISAASSDAFIFGDTVDSVVTSGVPFSTSVYNSGTMTLDAASPNGQANIPGGVAMAYLSRGDDSNSGAKQRYLVNGINGVMNINGWGNYGILMNQVDSEPSTHATKVTGANINLLINKGKVNINVTGRPSTSTEGNVGIAAFADNALSTGNDNSFVLNDNKGTITSDSGNNILLRHKGTGEVWNKGVMVINSGNTIGIDRENWLHAASSNPASQALGVNDGVIIVNNNVENVKAVSGTGNTRKHNNTQNTDKKIIIKNGDGITGGTDYDGNNTVTSSITKGISKNSLGKGGTVPGSISGMRSTATGMSAVTTTLDNDPDIDKIIENKTTVFNITIAGKKYNYTTQDGVIFLGGRNSAGLASDIKNIGAFSPQLDLVTVRNETDGKIFIYSTGNGTSQYTIGINGMYSTVENRGGIFLGLTAQNGSIAGSASDVTTESAVTTVGNYNYIGIYGKGSSISNTGFITDKASDNNHYSKKAIGIYAENAKANNVLVGRVTNSGNITLGIGGSAVITKGLNTTDKINLTSTGVISVAGDQTNQGLGFTLENAEAVISNKINLSGENTIGIYGKNSIIEIGSTTSLEIAGNNIKNSMGIVGDTAELKVKNGSKISLLSGENNIGIYGKNITYTDKITGTQPDYLTLDMGNSGIGAYLTNLASDSTIKINTIKTGNTTTSQLAGGIYATSASGTINIRGGDIKIGSTLADGGGFGIYVSGRSGTSGVIDLGINAITVNQKSGLGIYANNITNITTGNITTGKTGVFQNNSMGTGALKTGKITLTGKDDNMIGVYTSGSATNVEINGLEMTGLEKLTGIYVGKGGFKNTGNISIKSGKESYGIYIKGDAGNKTVDFGSGTSNIVLGNESLGLYLDTVNVAGTMPTNITVGDSLASGKQSVGIYAKDTAFINSVNTNVISGKESVGVYFDTNTGNVEYNGNVSLGENSLGIYKKGNTLKRNASSSLIFTGANNTQSTGFYLDNAILDFTSGTLNTNTLSMNSGIAFLLKGNTSDVRVNGTTITPSQLDSLGLAPKVERIVYSEKNESVTGDITLDPAVRYYGHRAKDGRVEISGNIYTSNNITSTYGVAVQNRYTVTAVTEEVLLNSGYTIDMSKSSGSVGVQSLASARAVNKGKIIVGSSSSTSAGIGILAESKNGTADKTSVINDSGAVIEMPYAGIGIYLDSLELGGSIINKGTISSTQASALGIYAKMSSAGALGTPITTITNTGNINLSNKGFGIFTDNSTITNSGNITVDNPAVNSIIAVYGGRNSVINNTGGNISVGAGGIAFYGNKTAMTISGGNFSTESGTLIYGENGTNITYTANGTTLGNKIGIYLDQSKIDLGGKNFSVMDSGSAIYLLGGNAEAKSLGIMTLKNNSDGVYVKNSTLNVLGGTMNITGSNSTGIISVNSNIENTTTINADITAGSVENKGILAKADNGGTYTIRNKASINIAGANSLGIYGSALDSGGSILGTINIINENNIKMGSASGLNNMLMGIYGTKNVNIFNTSGNINGGNYTAGIYSAGGTAENNSNINLGNASVGMYMSGGTGTVGTGGKITIGNGIRKVVSGSEKIESGVALYASNGAVITNLSSNITVGSDSIIGYSKGAGSKIVNKGNLILGTEAIGFYTSGGELENHGTLSSGGDGVIYFYGKNGKIINNGNINGSAHNYGVGVYGSNSEIINTANIILGNTYYNPAKADSPSDPSHRYAVGIYGDQSKIYNNGEIRVGQRGIGIYSYGQTGDLINDTNGKIISSGDNAVGLLVEGSGSHNVINNGNIILSGKNSVGASINRNTTIINNGLIQVSGENSVGIMAEASSKVINNSTINALGRSTAGVVLRGGSILENNGTITGLVLSDDVANAVSGASTSATTATSISGYADKLPRAVLMSYSKPTIINSGIINVDNNFLLNGVNLIIKPDLNNPLTTKVSSGGTDFIYNAVKVTGGKIEKGMLVEVTPDFAEGTTSTAIQLLKTFKPSSGTDIKDFNVISQSILWAITPSYNKDDGTSIDLVATKKSFYSMSKGLWYENFADNLDKNYSGSTGDALKIYNKANWLTSDKDLRHVMASLAGNVYANINQREMNIESVFDNSVNFLQSSENNTKENVKMNIIAGKGELKEDTDGVADYTYKTAGVLALREVERTYRHTFGYSLGYANTSFDMKDGNNSEETVNTIQLGFHNKYSADSWKIKNNLTGRVSFHDIDRNIMWPTKDGKSEMSSRYEVYSISSDNILGKEVPLGKNASITPYGAIKAVYMTRPDFTEDGLESLEVEGNDAWSVKPRIGIELKGEIPLGTNAAWKLKGGIDLAYEYELADIDEREYARLTAIENDYHELSKPEDEKGAFRGRASMGVEAADRYGIFLTGEYVTGENDNEDYRAGVSLKAVF